MKIVIIHGQSHKGSTYNIANILAKKIGDDITEFFLPRDFDNLCIGCTTCILKGEDKCPHYEKLKPITDALDIADVIILASPTYVYHPTGSMKNLLDHYGYRWMVHRPNASMFKKQAVCISTAAGAGTKKTNKDMADSLFYWGIPKIVSKVVAAMNYETVSDKKKKEIEKATDKIAKKIKKKNGKVKPRFKTKLMFNIMRMVQKSGWNAYDAEYWKNNGWMEKNRPWKKK